MNETPQDPRDRAFAALVRLARRDTPAPVDSSALLRALREAPVARIAWWEEFAAVFSAPAMLTACLGVAFFMLATAGWLAWDTWQHVLPWAELINGSAGILGGGAL